MLSKPILRLPQCLGFAAAILLILPASSVAKHADKSHETKAALPANAPAVLWRDPGDIASRNLYYGPGGENDAPHTTYTFEKEDLNGTNPKFDVRDENGVKWRVKMGVEARPEVVATRLVWAVGYYANEDYFLSAMHVENMPHLKRGQNLVGPDGTVHNVRLKRYLKDEKKIGDWQWRDNPFERQRELNGLRVMMALMNNWDLKDSNNAVYEEGKKDVSNAELRYEVSDLGASFGTTGLSWSQSRCKGNLKSYEHSNFVRKVTPEYVDLTVPSRPALVFMFFRPGEFKRRMDLRWIGKDIPRSDARWIGGLLAQLSAQQLRDAFRAAGYSAEEVEAFAEVVQGRIAELNKL